MRNEKGCPISRVPCEKWGFDGGLTQHPLRQLPSFIQKKSMH